MLKTFICISSILLMLMPTAKAQEVDSGFLHHGLKIGVEADYTSELMLIEGDNSTQTSNLDLIPYYPGVFINFYLSKRFFVGPYFNISNINHEFYRGDAGDTVYNSRKKTFGLDVGYDCLYWRNFSLACLANFGYSTAYVPATSYYTEDGIMTNSIWHEDYVYKGLSYQAGVLINYKLLSWLEVGAFVGLNYTHYKAELRMTADWNPYGYAYSSIENIDDHRIALPIGIRVSYVINKNPYFFLQ